MIQIVETGYQTTVAPGSVLDYGFDWTQWLAGDTVATSAWATSGYNTATGIPVPQLTQTQASLTTTTTAVFLSGFLAGNTYTATNTITTAAGRTTSRSWILICHQI